MPHSGHHHEADNEEHCAQKVDRIKSEIRSYPDFPKKGILFRDFLPILTNPSVFSDLIDVMVSKVRRHTQVQIIVGLDARGFLLGPVIAQRLQLKFVPVRKAGKLPGKVKQVSYEKEYGKDTFEIQSDSVPAGSKCVLVDDLLATGGSLSCAIQLVKECGAYPIAAVVVIELVDLKGRDKLAGVPVYPVVTY